MRKGSTVAKHCVFPMIWGSRGSKSRLAQAAGAEPAGQMRDEIARRCGAKHISKSKCTKHTSSGPLLEVAMSTKHTSVRREAHFEVKMEKPHELRTTFGSWDVEKVHAVVVWSTLRSQNVETTPAPDHFWKLRCRESARRCGAKHISKSKVQKTEGFGALFDRRTGLCILSKVSKTWGFCSFVAFPKTMAGAGHLKRICKSWGIGWRFQEGLGTSFSRERMTYFGPWILKHISVVFWMMQLHAILDHFLKHKWWVDRELHFHVPVFLKNCTCRTGINMSRKWLDQAPKNIDLYLCFFRFPGLWLVTVPLIFSLAHGGSCELPPKSIFFIPRHVDLFCRKNIV